MPCAGPFPRARASMWGGIGRESRPSDAESPATPIGTRADRRIDEPYRPQIFLNLRNNRRGQA